MHPRLPLLPPEAKGYLFHRAYPPVPWHIGNDPAFGMLGEKGIHTLSGDVPEKITTIGCHGIHRHRMFRQWTHAVNVLFREHLAVIQQPLPEPFFLCIRYAMTM